jgi:hypothetical protein
VARVTLHDEQRPAIDGSAPEPAPAAARQTVKVTAIAQDPSVRVDGRILTAPLEIPAEHLHPGPRGARFQVIDYDADRGKLVEPARFNLLDGDPFEGVTDDAVLLHDPRFRALNAYAVAARTLATFERALGRRLEWASPDHQLNLVPRAFAEANAFYAPDDGAVFFGFVPTEAAADVQTALSHDIVAHEVTHAILDGLRPRFNEPGLPDQLAFHEALGDIVALLSVFSVQEVVERLISLKYKGARVPVSAVTPDALRKTALVGLAEELGKKTAREGALRRSAKLKPLKTYLAGPEYQEPHRRGEIVVAAVVNALIELWTKRLADVVKDSKVGPSRVRVAEEGAKVADQLLRMVIRGIDYMPPVDLEFGDVLEAIWKADDVVAPDDQRRYRLTLKESFQAYGIERSLATADVPGDLLYDRSNYASLRSSPDEVFRFLWDNAHRLGIDRRWHTVVTSVRPSVRVGPDGLVVAEVVAEYTQTVNVTGADLPRLPGRFAFKRPAGIAPDTKLQLWGGGVLVFDQFGRAKYHVRKPIGDGERQRRRLEYLVAHGLVDDKGRFGFTLPEARGQRFAALHVPDDRAVERW